jgi:hypothetical protein
VSSDHVHQQSYHKSHSNSGEGGIKSAVLYASLQGKEAYIEPTSILCSSRAGIYKAAVSFAFSQASILYIHIFFYHG